MKSRIYLFACEEAKNIRIRVFVEEQGFEEEFDDTDKRSLHAVVYSDDGVPLGTGRLFSTEKGVYHIGRVAVEKEARGTGVGLYIMERLYEECVKLRARKVQLWSQAHAVEFYIKAGFEPTGEEMYEQDVRHVKMVRYL